MLLCQQIHKTHSTYHLITLEPPAICKMIDCVYQTGPRKGAHSILQYVTRVLDVYQVCHGVGCCVRLGIKRVQACTR